MNLALHEETCAICAPTCRCFCHVDLKGGIVQRRRSNFIEELRMSSLSLTEAGPAEGFA